MLSGLLKIMFPAMRQLGLLVMILSISKGQQPCSKDGKPCTWRNFKKIVVENKAIRLSNLISSHNVHRLGECHLLCIGHKNCYGYNFRPENNVYSKNCQLSNRTKTMKKGSKKNGVWTYYEDVLVTQDVNECSSSVCDSNADCTNTVGSYTCQCRSGYSGNGLTCSDVNECPSSVCHSNADCINTVGSYTCQCRTGYSGNGRTCTDVNECSLRTHSCSSNADCSNTIGSYTCQCRSGYEGDGKSCLRLCGNPGSPSGGYASGTRYTEGSSVHFYCYNSREVLSGPSNTTCQANGAWKNPTPPRCASYGIRLVGTSDANRGRVEVYHPSYGWGTVCDDMFDLNDGKVICRQLGYRGVNEFYDKAYYGEGAGPILFDHVECLGNESYIWDCKHPGWETHHCVHGEDSSVDCY